MNTVTLVFPHQLFEKNKLISKGTEVILVEEFLFFSQYAFHKQKLAFHRATMQYYKDLLLKKKANVTYVAAQEKIADIRKLISKLEKDGVKKIKCYEVTDNYLDRRLRQSCSDTGIELEISPSPLFINTEEELADFFKPSKKKFFQTSFYKAQRVELDLLMDRDGKPAGGKWTYDVDNRKKYPKKKQPPLINFPDGTAYHKEARAYVQKHFGDNLGEIDEQCYYPVTHKSSAAWFEQFLEHRFFDFGIYEDAIVADQLILNHSVLTPMLNVGLLEPKTIIDRAVAFSVEQEIPINSVEGFVRQIIGWREFIRGIYMVKGSQERTTNFWKFKRKIPPSFYDGTTGILPIDVTIKKVLKTGYCHHIERLMVLGSFMVLCEFDPDEVYRWFMELFIDAYDWVMVPNVYGMSQFADGGLMSTKPYISGSNYLMKMSNYTKGPWQEIWDGLFWRFMHVHKEFFLKNPRLGMLVRTLEKMPDEKRNGHLSKANKFLKSLDKS